MNANEPSFRRLFEWSRYSGGRRVPLFRDDDSPEDKARHYELERFVVAALAFCLKHDKAFLQHFWNEVCRTPRDARQMPRIGDGGIQVEAGNWCDLRLLSEDPRHRTVWIVEAKVGAPLKNHQNPLKPQFKHKQGYGRSCRNDPQLRGAQLRYIVLGCKEKLNIADGTETCGIAIQERPWGRLQNNSFSPAPLVQDFFTMLGQVRIAPFYMNEARKITVTGDIKAVGDAFRVLTAVCDDLKIKRRKDVNPADDIDDGWMGVYMRRLTPTEIASSGYTVSVNNRTLQKVVGGDRWCLGWLGYWYKSDGSVSRGVGFACADKPRFEAVKAKLEGGFACVEPDEITNTIEVKDPTSSGIDFEWFESVIKEVLR